ncbi:hypothetical protein MTR67_013623, partial [Solanum verrucosum]
FTFVRGACLTQDNLCKRTHTGVICVSKTQQVSTMSFYTAVTTEAWNFFLTAFGLKWVMPQIVKQAYESWYFWRVDKIIRKIWGMVPAVIFWYLWTESNTRCFASTKTQTSYLKSNCLANLFSWNALPL